MTQSAAAFEQLVTYSSTVTIEELTGRSGGQPRKVVLKGPSLPFKGAEWGFENNLVTTWYPGNAIEGTQQNLGPRELPSTWEGEWKRTLMGKTPTSYYDESGDLQFVISPHVLREVLEDMGRGGAKLRVTWAAGGEEGVGALADRVSRHTDVKIVREGRIKSFKTPIDRHTDIRWTIEFNWVSRGQKQDKTALARDDQDASTIANSIESAIKAFQFFTDLAKLKAINERIPRSAKVLTLGQLESLAGLPTTIVNNALRKLTEQENNFKRVADIALKATSQGSQVLNAVGNFARNSRAIGHQTEDSLNRIPVELQSTKDSVDAILNGNSFFDNLKNSARTVAKAANDVTQKVSQQSVALALQGKATVRESSTTKAGQITSVHLAKTGDTPQSVSSKYFKTPDRAADILMANKMPLHTPAFRPGQVVVIPAPATTQRGRP
jgi:hypothetical protein